jgi:hypothetical protein
MMRRKEQQGYNDSDVDDFPAACGPFELNEAADGFFVGERADTASLFQLQR